MARRRRISDLTGGPPSLPPSIFGPDDDNTIPGEVIVSLEPDAAASAVASVGSIPLRGAFAEMAVTETGASSIDKVLADLQTQAVTRVHGPSPTEVVEGMAMATDLGLDTTLRVRYAADEAPEAVADRLGGLNEVAWAEPNRWREASLVPNDPQFGSQWGLTRINCPDAWDHTTGDPSIVVAVVDTGVDLNHPELAPLLLAGQDFVDFPPGSIPKPGWVFEGDFTGVDANPQDEVGHGTHVAGTICCLSNNGVGVAGVAWNVRLLPVRVLARIRETATGRISGSGSAANIAAGIRWAADNGARVINMSLGGYSDTLVEREAVAYAISRGVVVVAAMGNDNTTQRSFPAAYPSVIAVAATDSGDHRASFSNRGDWVDVSGPGVGVRSTYWDDTYASLNGTSMATPHVAGVAALVLSRNASLTADQVGNIIRTTARPLRDNPADPVPNDSYGHGLVQAGAAVVAAAPVVKSRQVLCQRSVGTPCVSIGIACTVRVLCQPSVATPCASRQIICQKSVVDACPSIRVQCISEAILCQVSGGIGCPPPVSLADCPSLPCPESLACRTIGCGPGGGGPGPLGAQWEEYDPYGYDPYGTSYE
jgi:subtilisin family serine protease